MNWGDYMESYEAVQVFIDYILDEDDEGYNDALPFGGIQDNSPDEVKKAYDDYVKRQLAMKKRGIKD